MMKWIFLGVLIVFFLNINSNAAIFNVRDFGDKADKKHNDAQAIQQTIDECHHFGGGTVYFPSGDYLCGQIRLKSHVILHLEAGATIWASRKKHDKNFNFDNIPIYSENGILIQGKKQHFIENLSLQNITFRITRGFDFSERKKPKSMSDLSNCMI